MQKPVESANSAAISSVQCTVRFPLTFFKLPLFNPSTKHLISVNPSPLLPLPSPPRRFLTLQNKQPLLRPNPTLKTVQHNNENIARRLWYKLALAVCQSGSPGLIWISGNYARPQSVRNSSLFPLIRSWCAFWVVLVGNRRGAPAPLD